MHTNPGGDNRLEGLVMLKMLVLKLELNVLYVR